MKGMSARSVSPGSKAVLAAAALSVSLAWAASPAHG